MTINKATVDEFYATHGHYGLIRGGPCDLLSSGPRVVWNLPEVDYATLPESMAVDAWCSVESQGGVGSCQGHAQTSAAELAIYRETQGSILQLNRMQAYLCSQKKDGIRGDNGSTMTGGAESAKDYGIALESLWPYTGRYVGFEKIPSEVLTDAATRKLRHFEVLDSYADVMKWLVHGIGGVVIGIGWNSTCEPDSQGKVERYRNGGGGHALAVLDWTRRFADGQKRPYIQMFNSWGRGWGQNGIAFISPSVVQTWCDSEEVLGYSDLDGPDIKPRAIWVPGSICA